MASIDDVRRIALQLPGTTEVVHFGAPSFRAGKKIFAVLREPGKVTLGLNPDDQANASRTCDAALEEEISRARFRFGLASDADSHALHVAARIRLA